jgi:hypothetical protein
MGVYAQQAKYFNSIGRDICPRQAFIVDLKHVLSLLMEAGHHVILTLESNEDIRRGPVSQALQDLQLREVILEQHGQNAPSTYRRNTNEVPIDGIWATKGIEIKKAGYFAFDEVISGTDHRTIWMDISYTTAFGHDSCAPIIRPNARRLNNKNPNVRDNFNTIRKKYASKYCLLERIILLEESLQDKITDDQIKEYEALDKLRRTHLRIAENQCRKLRKGNVHYSDVIQDARNKIEAWSLLLRFHKGLKTSSRKIARTLKRAGIPQTARGQCQIAIIDELKAATKHYYELKQSHKQLRLTHLDRLAETIAATGNMKKLSILKQLRHREAQRDTAR